MPSMDRRWRAMYGLALSIFALPMVAVILLVAVTVDHFEGSSALDVLGSISSSELSPVLFVALIVWVTFSFAQNARQRLRQRALTLAGAPDAMLPARAIPVTEGEVLPDLTREPLSLLWLTKNGPRGVIATSEGLVSRLPRKPDILLRWSDARLLEIWRFSGAKQDGYALFDGAGAVIEWVDYRPSKRRRTDDGVALAERRRRERLLLALINARTGLQPRTLVPDLAAQPTEPSAIPVAPHTSPRRISLWITLIVIVFVAIPLGVAAAAITLPLTRSPLLNVYVTATMGALGLFLLGLRLRALTARRRNGAPAQPPFILLPSVPAEWTARMPSVVLREPRGIMGRIRAGVIGALLIGDGYAAFRSNFDFNTSSNTSLASLGGVRYVIANMVFIISLLAFLICLALLFASMSALTVDEHGLRRSDGNHSKTLAWAAMSRLTARGVSGKVTSFSVANGDTGEDAITLTWRANWRWRPRPPTVAHVNGDADSNTNSDAAELAALVAQRTGLALTVEDES